MYLEWGLVRTQVNIGRQLLSSIKQETLYTAEDKAELCIVIKL